MRSFSFFILLLLAFSVFGQEKPDTIKINEVIITGDAIFDPMEAGMQIISTDSLILEDKQGNSLATLLSENTAVYIKSYAHGSMSTASFRGTASSHTQVEWNGLEINSPMLGMVDFSLIPVTLIDELSIYQGNSSTAQSSGGLGGAIELKNNANWNNCFSTEYTQVIGSYHNDHEYFKVDFGNRRFQSKTRIYQINAKNDFTFENKSIGDIDPISGEIIHPMDTNSQGAFHSKGLMQELYWQANERNFLSLQYWGQKSDRNLPRISSYEGPDNSSINSNKEESHRVSFHWKSFGEKQINKYRAAFEYLDMQYKLENSVPGLGVVPVNNSGSNSLRFVQSIQHERQIGKKSKYTFEIKHQWIEVQSLDTVSSSGYHKSLNEISLKNAFFTEIGKKIHTSFILRSEFHGNQIKPIIPFFGIDYKPSDSIPFVIKMSASSNYHFPSLNDLYWSPGGNPDLQPEHGISYEGGLHYIFSKKKYSIQTSISFWHSNISDWIIWLPSVQGFWEPQNIRKVRTQGIEASIQAKYQNKDFRMFTNVIYSYGSSINLGDSSVWGGDSYGKQLSFIPKQSANVFLQISWKKFFVNYQHNHYGERFTSSSNEPGRRFSFYPYFMNNVSIGKKLAFKNTEIYAECKVNNLFNETYHSLLIQPMPGRNYMLIFRIKYKVPCKD